MPGKRSPVLASILVLILAAACWLGARALSGYARSEQQSWPAGEGSTWLPPAEAAPIMAMGYRQLWADINWARVLVYHGNNWSDNPEFRYRYLTQFLDTVIALDPKFERIYEWAAYSVTYQGGTVDQDEFLLSVEYLERGMEAFPDRYVYPWIAGIRYFVDIESDDPEQRQRYRERGAELIERAMSKPDAPENLALTAAGLRSKLGQKERALDNLRQVILSTDDPEAQQQLIATYQSLAGEDFPDEELRAKEELEQRWLDTLPFAPPNLYIVLGDPPSPVIDFGQLAMPRDLFSASLLEDTTEPEPVVENAADADAATTGADVSSEGAAAPSQSPDDEPGAATDIESDAPAVPAP